MLYLIQFSRKGKKLMGSSGYQFIHVGLDFGTSVLTPEIAYFLGLLLANERTSIGGNVYWLAPVRHNPKKFTMPDLRNHFNTVCTIAAKLNHTGYTHMVQTLRSHGIRTKKFNAGKNGFVTLFKQTTVGYTIDELVDDISAPLLKSPSHVCRAFLIGVFDGRSSYDKTAQYISIDLEERCSKDLVEQVLNLFHLSINYNALPSARKRSNPASGRRKKQLRVRDFEFFLRQIGYLSETRFTKAVTGLASFIRQTSNTLLPDLKTIR